MATRPYAKAEAEGRTHRFTWPLANGDDGQAAGAAGAADRTVQVFGTFGAGGTVIFEGSLEEVATIWFPLVDAQGNAISFTAAGGEIVLEMTRWVRPRVTAGDATTDLTFIMLSRSTT